MFVEDAGSLIDIGTFAAYGSDAPFFEEVSTRRSAAENEVAKFLKEAFEVFFDSSLVVGPVKPPSKISLSTSEAMMEDLLAREAEGEDVTELRKLNLEIERGE